MTAFSILCARRAYATCYKADTASDIIRVVISITKTDYVTLMSLEIISYDETL